MNEEAGLDAMRCRATGFLRITTRIHGTRKFILVGDQNISEIRAILNMSGYQQRSITDR